MNSTIFDLIEDDFISISSYFTGDSCLQGELSADFLHINFLHFLDFVFVFSLTCSST